MKKSLKIALITVFSFLLTIFLISQALIYFIMPILSDVYFESHIPTEISQTKVFFVDDENNKYFFNDGILYKYSNNGDQYAKVEKVYTIGNNVFEKGKFATNGSYLFSYLYNSKDYDGCLCTFDKSIDLINKWEISSEFNIVSNIIEDNNYIYSLTKGVDDVKLSLVRFDLFGHNYLILRNDLDDNCEILIDDMKFNIFCYGYDVYLSIGADNNQFVYENLKLFYATYYLKITKRMLTIQLDKNTTFSYELGSDRCRFYPNCYVFDKKIVFAINEYKKDLLCGDIFDCCVCGYQKSFLYIFDLLDKNLTLISEYQKGTFLIDYDYNGAKYYFDGGIYDNGVLLRNCEFIKEGETNSYKNGKQFYPDEYFKTYFLAYYDGKIYGI